MCGVDHQTFAHSTSAAMSRTFVRSIVIPGARRKAATRADLGGMTSAVDRPTVGKIAQLAQRGKWKVRA